MTTPGLARHPAGAGLDRGLDLGLVAPDPADVVAVTEQVWTSFLGEDQPLLPRPVPAGTPLDVEPGNPVWSATVTVAGGWNGAVTVELSHRVAVGLTRTMLLLDEAEETSDADVADAVGELVNMVGGNVKSLMPGPSRLSLPAVAAGRAVHPSDSVEVAHLDGLWAGEPVRVTVHAVPATTHHPSHSEERP